MHHPLSRTVRTVLLHTLAIGVPAGLTVLLHLTWLSGNRNYLYPYLGVVAIIGMVGGASPAFLAAVTSFLLVDYSFVPPVGTLTIADSTDLLNLIVFLGTAGIIGFQSSRRLRAQHQAELLASHLAEANVHLEQLNRDQAEAASVAVSLAQTRQEVEVLKRTDRLRRELIANVSHELRTPLTNLLMGTTSLLDDPNLPGGVRTTLRMLEGEEHRLARLVGDMLDLARLEAGALDLTLTEFSLADAVDSARERFVTLHPERTVSVATPDEQVDIDADWDRVGQILDNLLSNAGRFAPPGTPITITIERGSRGFGIVHVVDEGPGVPKELRETVFERFVTDSTGAEDIGGIGLGLAIVKGLVEAQGGHVWIEDGSRSDFGLSFPLVVRASTQAT